MADAELLSRTFVELADTLIDAYDPIGFLHTLTARCLALFGAAEAGVMLTNQRGGLEVLASSSERMRLLELFELQSEEGPCFDCHGRGERVEAARLEESIKRWPGSPLPRWMQASAPSWPSPCAFETTASVRSICS